MPPRYAYWTIIADGLPTAFRATEREELMPTYQRLREKHPDAVMKWFARGKLWDSPEQARRDNAGARDGGRDERRGGGGSHRAGARDLRDRSEAAREPRDRNWRPGGEHRDPRQKFKDAKKARNLDRRQEKFARKHGVPRDRGEDLRPPREKPHGDALLDPPRRSTNAPREGRFSERPQFRGPSSSRPGDRKGGGWQKPGSGFREKPHGDPLRGEIDGSRRSAREPVRERPRSDQARGTGSPRDDRSRQPAPGGPRKDDWRNRAPRDARGERGPKSDHRDRGKWGDRPSGPAGPRKDQQRDSWRRDTRAGGGAQSGDRGRRDDWRDRQSVPREKPHGDPLRKDIAGSAPRRDDRRENAPRSDRRFQKPDRFSKDQPTTGWRGRPAPPKNRPHGDPLGRQATAPRAFKPGGFIRGQGTDEPRTPPRPPGPNREPAPSERPEPSPPPRPSEPSVLPPGPPERGEPKTDRPRGPRHGGE